MNFLFKRSDKEITYDDAFLLDKDELSDGELQINESGGFKHAAFFPSENYHTSVWYLYSDWVPMTNYLYLKQEHLLISRIDNR